MKASFLDFNMGRVKTIVSRLSFWKILIAAFVIRLVVSPFLFHSDLNNHAIWGIYAQEFGLRGFYDWLNFGYYAYPNYPPLANIMFMFIRNVWQVAFDFLWKINVMVDLFPSGLIPWMEGDGYLLLMKIPAMISDIGIGLIIYNLALKQKIKEYKAKQYSSIYLFNPAVIYLSSCWGQMESVVGLLALMSVFFISQKKFLMGLLSFYFSLMTKVNMILAAPIILIQVLRNKINLKGIVYSALILIFTTLYLGNIYIDRNPIFWLIKIYLNRFARGPADLPFINLNAFNTLCRNLHAF